MERIKLLQKLQEYPTLKALLGEEWFLKRLSEREKNPHLLVELLLEEGPEVEHLTNLFNQLGDSLKTGKIKESLAIDNKLGKLLYFSQFLKDLERYLYRLKEVRGLSGIVDKLRELDDPEEFLFVTNVIEIVFNLFEQFDEIELETEPEPFEIIVKAKHKDRIIHFIFGNPEIVERIGERISSIAENSVIIPIVHMQHRRKLKELYDSKELSGFVIYDRMIHYGRSILMGFYIENPEAKNEPTEKEIELLCSSLHLIRFPTTKLVQLFSKKSVQEKLKKGGFSTIQNFLQELVVKQLAGWMKTQDDANLFSLLIFSLLRRKSDRYEYRCIELSSLLHLSALTVNAQNWWRELVRLKESFAFLQEGIAQIQNLETILSSKRKASEEIRISLLLPYYTSTVEGIFKIMSMIIVLAINIITGKSSKNLSKVGIPKLVQTINSFNKGELEILTKGYSQTLRNAISHGTCKIDLHGRKIVAIDRKRKEILTFGQLKKMRKRLEGASFMVALSLITILLRIALEQEKRKTTTTR